MEHGKDYFGFVYIWHDTKQSKFIIGSHLGSVDDRYTTSTGGNYVKSIFSKRPETMKRRILEYCTENSIQELHKIEQKWLDLRPDIITNPRYYNQKQWARGGVDKSIYRSKPAYWIMDHSTRQRELVKQGKHNFSSENTTNWAKKRLEEGTHHFITSDFNKKPFEVYLNGKFLGKFDSKVDAIKQGLKAGVVDKLRKFGIYKVERGSCLKNSTEELFFFKKNDILEYRKL